MIQLSELRARDIEHHISDPTRLDFYLLMFVTRGIGSHQVDFERHSLQKGDVLQIRPSQVHAFDAKSKHEALLLLFRPETVPPESIQRLAVHLSSPFQLNPEELRIFTGLLKLLLNIEDAPLAAMAPGLLQAVVTGLDEVYSRRNQPLHSPSNHRASDLVYRFEQLIHAKPDRHGPISDYIDSLHVTQRTLARACHEIRGVSPKKLIDQHCVLEAKRKLILGDNTVEEIAFDLGFSEATNFVKFFKRIAGLTPEAFRTKQREQAE
ncbi:MAG: AraC family transcriptional regulator [Verrucomicrobiales bacterium]|nr:AraC family transcriptional regulator [Verrucomicrobiales bacterium]